MSLRESLEEAEKKARLRELKQSVDLSEVAKQEEKANVLGYGLYRIKANNKIPFIQHLYDNTELLLKQKYITINELGFLTALGRFISIGSNAIKNPETDQFMTISEIATEFDMNRVTISKTINKLIDKGIILEIVSAKELKMYQRNVNSRPLFINPEIMYKGDKNKIDPMLCDMIMEFDYIEKNKVLLPYKVWHSHNEKYGKMYSRKTYLAKKKKK